MVNALRAQRGPYPAVSPTGLNPPTPLSGEPSFPEQTPYAAADAAFAAAQAYLSSREAQQMSESDLERELHRLGQDLMHKLMQGHREQRNSLAEAADRVEETDEVDVI